MVDPQSTDGDLLFPKHRFHDIVALPKNYRYTLWLFNIAMERSTIFNG